MLNSLAALVIGYFFGCLQSSYFLGRLFKGIDIREHGVNNAGASNAVVVMGWKFGILTALGDISKAVFAVLIAKTIWPDLSITYFAAGAGAFIGHCFPFFMQFRGGKGTATLMGMAFAIDIRIGFICLITGIVTGLISDYVVIATVCIFLAFFISIVFFDFPTTAFLIVAGLAAISLYKHRINFIRLAQGEEKRISQYLKKSNKTD